MIISASRRTDLPAFSPEETINKILDINNGEEPVDAVVFWSKNPTPIIPYLRYLDVTHIPFYFQYTLNNYPDYVEPGIPSLWKRIETFKCLSLMIGKERVIWRFDPLLVNISPPYGCAPVTEEYCEDVIKDLIEIMSDYTKKLIISFLDPYAKLPAEYHQHPWAKQQKIMKSLLSTTRKAGIQLATCAEVPIEGVIANKCIDPDLLVRIGARNINPEKDQSQRKLCGCCKSVDIGKYHTCKHNCQYCYAK